MHSYMLQASTVYSSVPMKKGVYGRRNVLLQADGKTRKMTQFLNAKGKPLATRRRGRCTAATRRRNIRRLKK
jgi:hypothetical protein